jgi:hypothetical protein
LKFGMLMSMWAYMNWPAFIGCLIAINDFTWVDTAICCSLASFSPFCRTSGFVFILFCGRSALVLRTPRASWNLSLIDWLLSYIRLWENTQIVSVQTYSAVQQCWQTVSHVFCTKLIREPNKCSGKRITSFTADLEAT